MNAEQLKKDITECLKFRKAAHLPEMQFSVDGDSLVWQLWGLEIVFHDFKDGGGRFYFNDTSGG